VVNSNTESRNELISYCVVLVLSVCVAGWCAQQFGYTFSQGIAVFAIACLVKTLWNGLSLK